MTLPIEVVEGIQKNKCVLFVGSRFSAEAAEAIGRDYPDDRALAKALGWKKPRRLMGTMNRNKGPVIPSVISGAQAYQQAHGRVGLLTTLTGRLGLDGVAPTPAHRTAVRRFPRIFTTNTDGLLEAACAAEGLEPDVRLRGDPVEGGTAERPLIYKMRGELTTPERLVVTTDDYAGAGFGKNERKAMRKIIRANIIFFVGYKPDEEEFEQLWADLSQCYGGELPRCHLAVAQGRINDYLWQKWVWRGLLMFTSDPDECMSELDQALAEQALG